MPGYLESNFLKARQGLPDFYWDGNTPFLPAPLCQRNASRWLRAPHSTTHGSGSLQPDARSRSQTNPCLVSWSLCGRGGMGRSTQRPGDVPVRRRRQDVLQALHCDWQIYQAHEQLLPDMPARSRPGNGEKACPFTTLYWDFLMQHEKRLRSNQRLQFQFKNLDRLDDSRRKAIREQAKKVHRNPGCQDGDSVKSQKEFFGN